MTAYRFSGVHGIPIKVLVTKTCCQTVAILCRSLSSLQQAEYQRSRQLVSAWCDRLPLRIIDAFVCRLFSGGAGRLLTTHVDTDTHRQTTRVDEIARHVDHY